MNLAMGVVPWASHEPEAPQSSWDHQIAKDSSGWFRPSWPITLSHTVLVGTCRRRSRPCPPHRRTLCSGYVRLKLLTGPRCLLQFRSKTRMVQLCSCDLPSSDANCLMQQLICGRPHLSFLAGSRYFHWAYCSPLTKRPVAWYGTNSAGAFIRVCHTQPKVRLRLPHQGAAEVHQEGYRLVLLPKMAFFALWDGVGAEYRVPRMPKTQPEVALPCGSQASAAKEGNGTSSVVDKQWSTQAPI